MHEMSDKKDLHRVLFMQSQTYYGADSRIHGLLMQTLDRSKVEVFTALNYGNKYHKSPAAIEIEKIPNVHIRKTNFGTTTFEKQRSEILKDSFQQGVPALISLGSLPAYVRKNKIDVIHCTEKPRDAYFGYLVSRASGAKCLIHLHVKAPCKRGKMSHPPACKSRKLDQPKSAVGNAQRRWTRGCFPVCG
jgi:hypothetical protein